MPTLLRARDLAGLAEWYAADPARWPGRLRSSGRRPVVRKIGVTGSGSLSVRLTLRILWIMSSLDYVLTGRSSW